MRYYGSTLICVMTESKAKGITFVVTRRIDNDRSVNDYRQYVNVDGTPSYEFSRKSTGR
jgi:hypothetical protein